MSETVQITKNLLLLVLASLILSFFALPAQAYGADSFLLGSRPHKTHTIGDIQQVAAKNKSFGIMFKNSYQSGFRPLTKGWGVDEYEPIKILPLKNEVVTKEVLQFAKALELEKKNLMLILKLRNSTYNKLAAMALGIFGNESEFGTSTKLKLKENFQELVILGKLIKGQKDLTTSRGLTQIKNLPEKLRRHYPEIKSDTLNLPSHAAVATVAHLTEAFSMLLEREDLEYINADNVFDYIAYVYSGQMRKVLNGPSGENGATVVDNAYIIRMKQNIRKFYFMELSKTSQ